MYATLSYAENLFSSLVLSVQSPFFFVSFGSYFTIHHSSLMSAHHDISQSTLESSASGSTEASHTGEASVSSRVAACEKLVDEAIERDFGATWLGDSLKVLGLKAGEAFDYIEEYAQRMEIRRSKAKQPNSPPHNSDVEMSDPVNRNEAVEEAAWASLRSKLETATGPSPSGTSSSFLDKLLELVNQEASGSSSLSKSVLAVAPHLAEDEHSIFDDPYLCETQKCKIAYAGQKPFENLIIKAQGRKVIEPIANSIWRLIILDKYVDFEKLYATLDPSYNPNDEAKEINDKFTLLEKNTINSKRSVVTEAEWMRLYDVWANAVLHFYPHRKAELSSYRELIVNMFRATSSALPAIRYDRDSRERYSRQPYRLDSSKDVLPLPLLSQLLSQVSSSPSTSGGKRRSSNSQEGPRKRIETICRNWNLGSCEGDPCNYGRRHNECCECHGSHRAKDRAECYATLNCRRQQQRTAAARGGRT